MRDLIQEELNRLALNIDLLEAQKDTLNIQIDLKDSSVPEQFQEKCKLIEDRKLVEEKLLNSYGRQQSLKGVTFILLVASEEDGIIEYVFPLFLTTESDIKSKVNDDIEVIFDSYSQLLPNGTYIAVGVRKALYRGETNLSDVVNGSCYITSKEVTKSSSGLSINPDQKKSMKKSFVIMPRVIAHLGEDLIKDESIAILELVKNSYDAGASICDVDFVFDFWGNLEKINVTDNGSGMDLETIENVWLVIGTDNKKRKLQDNVEGRIPLGEKGIGRLGVHKLGRRIKLYSKANNNNEIFVDIDWRKLAESEDIDDFKVDYGYQKTNNHFRQGETGTIIEITDLKGEWNRRKLRTVFRNLTSLNSPFTHQSDSFEVKVTAEKANPFAGLPNLKDILGAGMYFGHCVMRGSRIEDFRYEFKPWSSLSKIDGRVVENLDEYDRTIIHKVEEETDSNKLVKREEILDLSRYDIGQIEFDIVIYEKDNAIFNLMNLEKRTLNEYLKSNSGIRVYRDNMRVFNYGEPGNDWLGIDQKRLNRAGGSVSNNILIGSVSLQRKSSFGLREKTNREGFIEDEPFFAFVDAVRYALDLIVAQRNQDRFNLMAIYKQGKQQSAEPVIGELSEVITLIKEKVEDETDQKEILSSLYRMEKQYNDVRDTLIHSANIGINLGGAVHELEKQMSALKGFIGTGNIEKIKEVAELLDDIIERYASMMVKSELKKADLADVVRLVIEHTMFRFSIHDIRLFSNYKKQSYTAILSKTETISALNNLIDNSIYWVSRSKTSDRKIGIYLTDHIPGYVSILVCDNGPGFKLPPELAVRPFVSGKPLNDGMGLGLYISQQTMRQMKGKLLIQQDNEFDVSNMFKDPELAHSVVALCFPVVE